MLVSRKYRPDFANSLVAAEEHPKKNQYIESSDSESEEEVRPKTTKKTAKPATPIHKASPASPKPKPAAATPGPKKVRAVATPSSVSESEDDKPVRKVGVKLRTPGVVPKPKVTPVKHKKSDADMDVDVMDFTPGKRTTGAKRAGPDSSAKPKTSGSAKKTKAVPKKRARADSMSSDETSDEALRAAMPPKKRVKAPKITYRFDPKATYRVYLSQCKANEKERIHSLVKVLGKEMCFVGEVEQATHVVMMTDLGDQYSLSVLVALSAGMWILKPEWLQDSFAAQTVLDEIDYVPKNMQVLRAREARRERDEYLASKGKKESEADDDYDFDLPRLIFSDLTFCLDHVRQIYTGGNMEKLKTIIRNCAGKVAGEEASDIWVAPPNTTRQLMFNRIMGEEPDEADARDIREHPDYRKRHFTNPKTHRCMPTFAFTIEYIKDCVTQWQTLPFDIYENHIGFAQMMSP